MFNSIQLALDAAVLLTRVESCALSPLQSFARRVAFLSLCHSCDTRSVHVSVWTWQLLFGS